MKSRLIALAAVLILAGCGGNSTMSVPHQNPSPRPSSSSAPGSTQQYAKLTLTWKVAPSGTTTASIPKQPQYVSPNASKVEVKVNTVNGGAPPSWVNPDTVTTLDFSGTGNCTVSGGTATCTIQVAAPVGVVNYSFSVLDSSNDILATFTANFTIAQGQSNPLSVTLGGVVKTVTLTGPTLSANTPVTSAALVVSAFDASGAQIVGSAAYSAPFTLTDNDATGSTQLQLNGGTASSSVTVSSPSDVVTISYSGLAANPVTIAASGTGITGGGTIATSVQDVTFAGTTLDDAANGGLSSDQNWGQQTVFFSAPSGSQTVTASEVAFTNAPFNKQFTISLDPTTCGSGPSAVATVSPNPGPQTSFTITAQHTGFCKAKLSESGTGYPLTGHPATVAGSATHDGTFWISVTSASISVN